MPVNNRWAIFIDIEGFSSFKEAEFYRSVETVLSTIYLIGSKVYVESPDRLFVHQLGGDGFVIVSSFPEKDLSRPIAIATILLRSLVLKGYIAKVGVSVGDFADISGCWPDFYKLVEKDLPKKDSGLGKFTIAYDHKNIRLGTGRLTVIIVMGYALLNSYKTQSKGPKGPTLKVDDSLKEMIPEEIPIIQDVGFNLIDWIKVENDEITKIATGIGNEDLLNLDKVAESFKHYLEHKSDGVSGEWMENAKALVERLL